MSGEWYDINTDGTFLNGILYPGNDNALWNQPVSGAINSLGSVFVETTQRAVDLLDYRIDDSTLNQSQYNFNYRTFPDDIANDYVGHYMVININVPVFASGTPTQRTSYGGSAYAQTFLPTEYSKVDTLRFGGAENVGGTNPVTGNAAFEREPFAIPRYTRRIAESIAIFMPTPIIFNTTNNYQEVNLSSLGMGIATQTAALVGGAFRGEAGASALGGVVSSAGQTLSQISGLAGYPINPRVEVIFSTTNLRQYRFEFLLAPRNEKESESMKAIIRTLRYHSVPEIDPTTAGFTFIPPAEFDFTFYNKGVENTHMPRINTCVMDQIEVDYAPTGTYSTFSNGHPVMARLSLGVREVEILHKRRVLQGF